MLVLSSCREQNQEKSYSATSAILSTNSTESDLETYDSIVVPQSTTESKLTVLEEEQEVPTSSTSVSSEKVDIAAETKNQTATDIKSSQTTQAASPSASQTISINNGKVVYATPKIIQAPKESDFGEYYSYALDMYHQFQSGTLVEGKTYEFPHLNQTQWDAEVKDFFNTFQSTCLKDVDNLIPRSTSLRSIYHQSLDNSSGETKIIVSLDEGYFAEYQKIAWVQNTIQSIVGNELTEKAVIDRIANWCIRNCSYDYDYQYTGNYRDEYTIVQDLLQSKSGICNDFARLVSFTCDLYGIKSQLPMTEVTGL